MRLLDSSIEFGIDFHSHGVGAIFLRGSDHDAAIARSHIVNHVVRGDLGEVQHLLDDFLGRRHVRDLFDERSAGKPLSGW